MSGDAFVTVLQGPLLPDLHHPNSAPAPRATVPTKQADWEAVKGVIEDLYLRQNVRLKDVIEVMHTTHHFRATQVLRPY